MNSKYNSPTNDEDFTITMVKHVIFLPERHNENAKDVSKQILIQLTDFPPNSIINYYNADTAKK